MKANNQSKSRVVRRSGRARSSGTPWAAIAIAAGAVLLVFAGVFWYTRDQARNAATAVGQPVDLGNDKVKGPATATVAVVEFSDFQ